MAEIEFINNNARSIQLKAKDGSVITFGKMQKKILPEYFRKYCPRYLTEVRAVSTNRKQIKPRIKLATSAVSQKRVERRRKLKRQIIDPKSKQEAAVAQRPKRRLPKRGAAVKAADKQKRVVGRQRYRNPYEATKYYKQVIELSRYPISNDIGVGILSFNRLNCIKRLLDSIYRFTDLDRVTVFVSDESTDKDVKAWLRKQKKIVFIDNAERLGVSGNTNRLFRCLERFKYKLILNDDIQVTQSGWENIYPAAMSSGKYHHFCMRQPGVFGANAKDGKIKEMKNMAIQTIDDKPHGAVIAFDDLAFETVGYFDEAFGTYGMEHVDWSNRVSMSGIQPGGFHDLIGSEQFFKILNDSSTVTPAQRSKNLRQTRELYSKHKNNKSRIYVEPSDKSKVPEVSYIVPFQGTERRASIRTVINNIKAQRFPRIEIIVVEQCKKKEAIFSSPYSVKHIQCKGSPIGQFVKSKLLNVGVCNASCGKLILHDADMLVSADYTTSVARILDNHDACHIGKDVIYLDNKSTVKLNKNGILGPRLTAKTTVMYFEGGSLGIRRNRYFGIGGFYEKFVGYGCEDCEFFERLSLLNFCNDRTDTFMHLHHSRTKGWESCHRKNKAIHGRLRQVELGKRRDEFVSMLKKQGYKW